MLGHKVRDCKPLTGICLEDLVSADNLYRQLERSIDLSFVRELVAEFYSNIGRTSVDPVVFFKLQLIAFFEGIRSERKLMETVSLKLAHSWFIGYDLDEAGTDLIDAIRAVSNGYHYFSQKITRIAERYI